MYTDVQVSLYMYTASLKHPATPNDAASRIASRLRFLGLTSRIPLFQIETPRDESLRSMSRGNEVPKPLT